MKKWYYKMVDLDVNTINWQVALDSMGNDGWELVQIVQAPMSTKAIFKKTDVALTATGRVSESNQWM
jgi:hypothetical protein